MRPDYSEGDIDIMEKAGAAIVAAYHDDDVEEARTLFALTPVRFRPDLAAFVNWLLDEEEKTRH